MLSASSDEGNNEYGLPKVFQAVPARMYITAFLFYIIYFCT